RRIGKSSILLRLKRLFDDGRRYLPIYIDCEACFNDADFFAALREHTDVPDDGTPLAFQRTANLIRSKASPKQVVLLVDEIDELLAFDVHREPPGLLF